MRFLLGLLSLLCLLPGCGYHLSGTGSNLPSNARTIAIPKFANDSQHPEATLFVTIAVTEEFLTRSKLTPVKSIEQADLVLEGKIISFTTRPVSHDQDRMLGEYELRIVLDVKLVDRLQNRLLFEGMGMQFQEKYKSSAADFFNQEMESTKKIAQRIATFVVSSVLESF